MRTPSAAVTASSIWTIGPEPYGLIGFPLPLTPPGDPSSGASDAAPPPSPGLTGLACGPEPPYCMGRDEGTEELLGRGTTGAAVSYSLYVRAEHMEPQ